MVRIFLETHKIERDFLVLSSCLRLVRNLLNSGYVPHESKEVLMTTMLTLTATTVLLSSLFLLHRIW